MNLHDFAEKYGVSLHKARRMQKDGVLRIDATVHDSVFDIRAKLAKGRMLAASDLVQLIETPSMLLDLGSYADKAQSAIDALGNYKDEAAPAEVAAHIGQAARNDDDSIALLSAWIQSVIPDYPVHHNYVAVRLLLGIPANIRKFDLPRLPKAFLNCRRHPYLFGWWHIEHKGTQSYTVYHKPKGFDL